MNYRCRLQMQCTPLCPFPQYGTSPRLCSMQGGYNAKYKVGSAQQLLERTTTFTGISLRKEPTRRRMIAITQITTSPSNLLRCQRPQLRNWQSTSTWMLF